MIVIHVVCRIKETLKVFELLKKSVIIVPGGVEFLISGFKNANISIRLSKKQVFLAVGFCHAKGVKRVNWL